MNGLLKVLFYIKKGKDNQKKNGKFTINCRITYLERSPATFATSLEVSARMWTQDQGGRAAGKTQEAVTINRKLAEIHRRILDAYWELFNRGEDITAAQIKNIVTGVRQLDETLLYLYDKTISIKRQEKENGELSRSTFNRYARGRTRLEEFMKKQLCIDDISIRKVDSTFVKQYQNYLKSTYDVTGNTFEKYFEPIKNIVRTAFEDGMIRRNALAHYKIKKEKPKIKFLLDYELKAIMQHKFDIPRLERVRDVFIFQCFTGLSYAEMARLTPDKIKTHWGNNLWILTDRKKTGNESNIPILNIPLLILKKYEGKLSNGLVLPIISNQKMNGYLKEIADICGVKQELSTHCGRHTFATSITLAKNVSMETVSSLLGHQDIKITQTSYARVLASKVQSEMDELKPKLADLEEAFVL